MTGIIFPWFRANNAVFQVSFPHVRKRGGCMFVLLAVLRQLIFHASPTGERKGRFYFATVPPNTPSASLGQAAVAGFAWIRLVKLFPFLEKRRIRVP